MFYFSKVPPSAAMHRSRWNRNLLSATQSLFPEVPPLCNNFLSFCLICERSTSNCNCHCALQLLFWREIQISSRKCPKTRARVRVYDIMGHPVCSSRRVPMQIAVCPVESLWTTQLHQVEDWYIQLPGAKVGEAACRISGTCEAGGLRGPRVLPQSGPLVQEAKFGSLFEGGGGTSESKGMKNFLFLSVKPVKVLTLTPHAETDSKQRPCARTGVWLAGRTRTRLTRCRATTKAAGWGRSAPRMLIMATGSMWRQCATLGSNPHDMRCPRAANEQLHAIVSALLIVIVSSVCENTRDHNYTKWQLFVWRTFSKVVEPSKFRRFSSVSRLSRGPELYLWVKITSHSASNTQFYSINRLFWLHVCNMLSFPKKSVPDLIFLPYGARLAQTETFGLVEPSF